MSPLPASSFGSLLPEETNPRQSTAPLLTETALMMAAVPPSLAATSPAGYRPGSGTKPRQTPSFQRAAQIPRSFIR